MLKASAPKGVPESPNHSELKHHHSTTPEPTRVKQYTAHTAWQSTAVYSTNRITQSRYPAPGGGM
jgi:hypothetical protein